MIRLIRRATPDDVPALRDLATAAYARYIPRISRPPAPMTADYAALVHAGQVWVAATGTMLVGLLVLVAQEDHLLLDAIAVYPDAQGHGHGAALLAFAEDRARDGGFGEIRLYTNEAMTENLVYYPRHGYTETHRAVDQGFRRVYFRKAL